MAKTKFGRYEILSEIGRGGMATVYLARDTSFNRDVALKALPQQFTHDRSFQWRFEQEARVLANLEHYAILPVYDFGEEQGYPYIVMRYMTGGALTNRIVSRKLQLIHVVNITQRICDALDEAHDKGIVHRDLKPGNILFDQHGRAYLADFGIARLAEATASFTGSAIIGTPAYMSPEQVHGSQQIDGRSDLYAMGIIIFEMLAGRVPFAAETPTKQMMSHVLEPVPDILALQPSLPPALAAVVTRSLAKDPDDRFQTGRELGKAITAAVTEEQGQLMVPAVSSIGPPTLPGTIPLASSDGEQKPRIPVWLLGIIGILALAAVVWAVATIIGSTNGESSTSTPTQTVAELAEAAVIDTPEPTRAATPTQTKVAAMTRTPTSTSTRRLTLTPTVANEADQSAMKPTPVFEVVVNTSSINFRTGPGTAYGPVAGKPFLQLGDVLLLMARTADNSWFNVETEDGIRGWVSASVVDLVPPQTVEDVTVAITIPPAPTSTRTPTRVPTNTPVPPTPVPPPTNTPAPPTNTPWPTNTPYS